MNKSALRIGHHIEEIPASVLSALGGYHWPGNVRELENVIERAVIMCRGPVLQLPEFSPAPMESETGPRGSGSETLAEIERLHIERVLKRCGWRVRGQGGAAETLGIKPTTLDDRMKKLGIVRPRDTWR